MSNEENQTFDELIQAKKPAVIELMKNLTTFISTQPCDILTVTLALSSLYTSELWTFLQTTKKHKPEAMEVAFSNVYDLVERLLFAVEMIMRMERNDSILFPTSKEIH